MKKIRFNQCLLAGGVSLLACGVIWYFRIPNPNIVLFVLMSYFLVKDGYDSGIICGLVSAVYSAFFFSTGHNFISYSLLNLQKMLVIYAGILVNILLIGHLRSKSDQLYAELLWANHRLTTDNLVLQGKSEFDILTDTKNRFCLHEDLPSYLGQKLFIVFCDIDHFKHVNDTYGHNVGDQFLQQYASILKNAFGRNGVYRYGGDEFLIISTEGETLFAEKLKLYETMMQQQAVGNKTIPLQASCGIIHGTPASENGMRYLLREADKRMYKEKSRRHGKTTDADLFPTFLL